MCRFPMVLGVAFLPVAEPKCKAVRKGLGWALISASLFTGTRWHGAAEASPACGTPTFLKRIKIAPFVHR